MINYEGFPYTTFIESDIQKTLDTRYSINNRIRNITAWAKVTSGVVKKGSNELFSLSSFLNTTGNSVTPAGFNILYDENNRPRPGLESINVQYKSKYGGVRVAQINWKVHSVDQFNKYAPYFLNPGRTMLIEWGCSNYSGSYYALNKSEYDQLKSHKSFEAWEYLNNRSLKSKGTYDGMLGVITNYDFNLTDDGGYEIMTEVTSQGTLMYGVNLVHQSEVKNGNDEDISQMSLKEFVEYKLLDIVNQWKANPDKTKKLIESAFNTEVYSDATVYFDSDIEDQNNNLNKKFVNWAFIEDVIVTPFIGIKFDNSDTGKRLFKMRSIDIDENGRISSTKISNHSELRTTNLSAGFIYNSSGGSSINARVFYDYLNNDTNTGLVRNMYVNLELVQRSFLEADTLSDALINILNQINNAHIQYWDFNLKINEKDQILRVIDSNYSDTVLKKLINEDKNNTIKKIYLFRYYGGNGFIKDMSFSSKLSNDITMTALYGVNKTDDDKYIVNNDNDSFVSIWNKNNEYTDYFYEALYYKTIEPNGLVTDASSNSTTEKSEDQVYYDDIYNNSNNAHFSPTLKNLLPVYSTTNKRGENQVTYMKKRIYGYISSEDEFDNKDTIIVPADFEMTIEGVSGIRIGDIFWVDVVPDLYLENSVFQTTSVEHNIENNYWSTKIKAILKVTNYGITSSTVKTQTKGLTTEKIQQQNIIVSSGRKPSKSVLQWIKDNMGTILSTYQTGLYTPDILAGIMHTEASGPIYEYGVKQKLGAYDVCSKIKNADAGSTAYSFFQFNYNGVPTDYKKWIDKGGWKRPQEAASKAVELLRRKEKYIKSSVQLNNEELLKATIAAYNQGEGNSVKQLRLGQSVFNNQQYVNNVLTAAEEYRKL